MAGKTPSSINAPKVIDTAKLAKLAKAPSRPADSRCLSTREVEERARMVNRLNRIQGQIGGISDMVANGQPCEEVAQQMSAVRRALEKAYMHMMTCTLMEVTDGYTSEGAVKQDVQRVLDLLQKYA